MTTKQLLRKAFLQKRLALTASTQEEASARLCQSLLSFPSLTPCRTLAVYAAAHQEISLNTALNTWISQGKLCVFPRFDVQKNTYEWAPISHLSEDLTPGHFGILEPLSSLSALASLSEIDAWIIPGVLFDARGNRLGYGKGVYDSFLRHSNRLKIGVGYDWQVHPTDLPIDPTDIPVDVVITDQKIYA